MLPTTEPGGSTKITHKLLETANSAPPDDNKSHRSINSLDNFLSEFASQVTTTSAFLTSVCGWEELLGDFLDVGLGISMGGLGVGIPLALFFALCEKKFHDAENINALQSSKEQKNTAPEIPAASQDVSISIPDQFPPQNITALQKIYNYGHYAGEIVGSLSSWVMIGEVILKSKSSLAWRLGKCGFYSLFSIWKGVAKRAELENGVVYFQAQNKFK